MPKAVLNVMYRPLLLYVGNGSMVSPRDGEDDHDEICSMIKRSLSVFRSKARVRVVLLPAFKPDVVQFGNPTCIILDHPVLADCRKWLRYFAQWEIMSPVVCVLPGLEEMKALRRITADINEKQGVIFPPIVPVSNGEHQCIWTKVFLQTAA